MDRVQQQCGLQNADARCFFPIQHSFDYDNYTKHWLTGLVQYVEGCYHVLMLVTAALMCLVAKIL